MEPRIADPASSISRAYLLERYLSPGSRTDVEASVSRACDETAMLAEQGAHVAPIWAVYVPAEELCLSVIEAPSPEAIERAAARLSLTFDRIAEVVAIDPDSRRRGA